MAEKALISCGMAPAVWLLVQLHQARAISFYQLPGQTATVMPHLSAKGSCAEPTSLPTAGKTKPHVPASAPSDESKARAHLEKGETEEGHWEESSGDVARGKGPWNTVTLIGVSVDVAIIVVLSWAAQLAQRDVTSVMMQNDDITFELGE